MSVCTDSYLINRYVVADTISGIKNDSGCSSGGVQGQHCLYTNVHSRHIKRLKHDLRHLFAVRFWVERCFGEQDGMFFWGDSQFVVKRVVPNLLHVVPVCNDSMLDRVFERENAAF